MSIVLLGPSEPKLAENPEYIKIPLKDHQRTLLAAAHNLEQNECSIDSLCSPNHAYVKPYTCKIKSKVGVICDKVGSGKSLVVSSIIANNKYLKTHIPENYNYRTLVSVKVNSEEKAYIPINIILVPHTLIGQWTTYLKEQTTFNFYTINKTKHLEEFRKNFEQISIENEIVLISNTRYKDFETFWMLYLNCKCSRFIIDEADSIKLSCFDPVPSHFIWLVTASWETIRYPSGQRHYTNSNGEISQEYNYELGFTRCVYLNPLKNTGFIKSFFQDLGRESCRFEITKSIFLKNEDSYVDSSFRLILPEIYKIICKNPVAIRILNKLVAPHIIGMLNAGNTEAAIESMKCVKTGAENLLTLVTEDISNDIENKRIEFEAKSKMIYSSKKTKEEALTKIQEKIKELERKKRMLIDRISENDMCSICFDTASNPTYLNCCQSKYCFECISRWITSKSRATCPHCRADITEQNMIIVSEKETGGGAPRPCKEKKKDKLENMFEILNKRKDDPDFKCLIFSEYEKSDYSEKLKEFLIDNEIGFGYLKGTTSTIDKMIRDYKEGSLKCLIMNARYCGSGINLENSTDIIIYHSMSRELTEQVIGRAQRPGRTSQLKVWNLLYENEV